MRSSVTRFARNHLLEEFNGASMLGWLGFASPEKGCGRARGWAAKALEIDPGLGQAHTSLAWATLHYDYDFVTADTEFRRSIELDPRNPIAYYWYGLALAYMGRFEEAIADCRCALELDPLSPGANPILAMVYWFARQSDQLVAQSRRALQLYPEFASAHWALAAGYLETSNFQSAIAEMQVAVELSRRAPTFLALLGETYAVAGYDDEAQQIMRELQQRSQHEYVTPYMIACVYTALGQIDEAFAQLETAHAEHAAWMVMLKRDPRLDKLRSDSRYQALLRKMNFPS
jgi:tetratricopeptide (TPR) repeat protein